jgi:putative SOS response-associated peptidase YedK
MCGRFILGIQGKLWPDLVDLYPPDLQLKPRYNVAPTQEVPVVRNDGGKNRLEMMRWGLVPFYEKEFKTKFPLINARDDRILEARPYQGPFKSQ